MPQLGVHIADVTHFVRPDTPIDAEASARATTVYLVQRRIDMLPKALTEDICSLRYAATEIGMIAVAWTVRMLAWCACSGGVLPNRRCQPGA